MNNIRPGQYFQDTIQSGSHFLNQILQEDKATGGILFEHFKPLQCLSSSFSSTDHCDFRDRRSMYELYEHPLQSLGTTRGGHGEAGGKISPKHRIEAQKFERKLRLLRKRHKSTLVAWGPEKKKRVSRWTTCSMSLQKEEARDRNYVGLNSASGCKRGQREAE